LNDHAKAADSYRKQAEVNPFHKSTYNHLGAELQRMGKYDDALAAYGKQLENVPVDRVAGKQHALLLAKLNHKEALHELEGVNAAVSDDPEIELALARLYAANGIQDKSQALMKSVVGSPNITNGDLFAAALRDDIQPDETMEDAKNIVDTVSEQVESGEYEAVSPGMDSAMYFVALEWARIGWAKYLKGETLEIIRFLNSAWLLSQSGTLANRLARVYQKAGDKAKAKHFLLLAVAAGGSEAEISRAELTKLGGAADLAQAQAELIQMRKVKLPGLKMEKGEAEFSLVFSGSNKAERADFAEGDPGLLPAEQALIDATFSVSFPDVSSLKIVRRGVLSCGATGCAIALKPIESAGLFTGTSAQK